MDKNEILYTLRDVASLLHTSPNYIYNLVRSGKLKAIKIGSLKILKTTLLEFLEEYNGKDVEESDI